MEMEAEENQPPATNLSAVIDVLEDMRAAGIISDYAVGGAAAILHYEPISTVDLDIFFFLTEPPSRNREYNDGR